MNLGLLADLPDSNRPRRDWAFEELRDSTEEPRALLTFISIAMKNLMNYEIADPEPEEVFDVSSL